MKSTTKIKASTTATTAAPEQRGIHPEHREAAERLIARGRQQGYVTQEDIVRAIPDAEPGDQVASVHSGPNPPGDLHQHRVANVLPVGVVDRGETVQPDREQHATRTRHGDLVQQRRTIDQTGQRVGPSRVAKRFLQHEAFRNISEVYDESAHLRTVAQIAHRELGRPPDAEPVADTRGHEPSWLDE